MNAKTACYRTKKYTEIDSSIKGEKLKPEKTAKLIDNVFRKGVLRITGTDIDKIMPPVPISGAVGAGRAEKKKGVVVKLKMFFERFFNLV